MPASQPLHLLPFRQGSPAANMAEDILLLESLSAVTLRPYGWAFPCMTFGYSQCWAFAQTQAEGLPLVRRPTGGGVVDHRNDFTYSLLLPTAHPLSRAKASESYRFVHEALAEALGDQAESVPCVGKAQRSAPTVCFQRPEVFDLVVPGTHEKLAGAAQKRNRHGLLLQGSVNKKRAPRVAEVNFVQHFANILAKHLGSNFAQAPWPTFAPEREAHWHTLFASDPWNHRR